MKWFWFIVLCIVSIFIYLHNMTDIYMVPKWCFTLLVLLLSILILSVKRLCNKTIQVDIVVYSYIIALITFS